MYSRFDNYLLTKTMFTLLDDIMEYHSFFNIVCFFITDVVNQDLKSTLRVLYNIFTKYKEQGH